MTVIAVGTSAGKTTEKSHDVFRFTADTPIPPAGFNYGAYQASERHDERTGFDIESYLTPPRSASLIVGDGPAATVTNVVRSPGSSDVALANARASVELFSHWYGPLPYKRLAVTESPYIGSLPTVLFLPAAALGGMDITAYSKGAASRMERVIDETLPATASRQWMGALVAPASFHDLWLSRGLADFSAALFNEADNDETDVRKHWTASQTALMGQDFYGLKLRDAPPVWWGLMTDIRSTLMAAKPVYYTFVSNNLLTRKGGYIFHMLRQLMRDPQTGDRDFITTMRDFFATYANRAASTEDFIAIANKHMKRSMVLDSRGNIQWFFDEWVYGTDIPSYGLEYATAGAGKNGVKITGTLTQSGVGEGFRMRVRVYVRLGKRVIPALNVMLVGNESKPIEVTIPEEPQEVLLNAENDVLTERQEVHRAK
jgi:hypothetical protein